MKVQGRRNSNTLTPVVSLFHRDVVILATVKLLSLVQLFATPWTVAYHTPPSVRFSRQEYWSGLPFPSPYLPNPGIEPASPTFQVDSLPSEPQGKPQIRHHSGHYGEGNGNPLQCSCLENPRDGGSWWASVYGVAQSRTRLKRLSSSSSFTGVLAAFVFLFLPL